MTTLLQEAITVLNLTAAQIELIEEVSANELFAEESTESNYVKGKGFTTTVPFQYIVRHADGVLSGCPRHGGGQWTYPGVTTVKQWWENVEEEYDRNSRENGFN